MIQDDRNTSTRAGLLAGAAAGLTAAMVPAAAAAQATASALALFPRGVVLAWYSKSGAFPEGWAICDGTNGTPDLRGKFLYGVGNMSDVGKMGGNETHQHGVSSVAVAVSGTTAKAQGAGSNPDAFKIDDNRGCCPQVTGLDHTHAFSGSGGASGSTDSGSSIPPYVTVLYMMKL
jgi:microcystin-dependent protein